MHFGISGFRNPASNRTKMKGLPPLGAYLSWKVICSSLYRPTYGD